MAHRIPPPVIGVMTAVLMWCLARAMTIFEFQFAVQSLIAGAAASVGLCIDAIAVFAFFRARTTINPMRPERASELVTSGVFRLSRNPMYLGMLLVLTGWALWLGQALNAVLLVLFVWVITEFQIKPEERALTARFGDAFTRYCQRVRRWI
ncbi:MAG: isoprenylcysteine carboxylmethyltransferase family protein [Pseudomonadota bacterium]